jgi:hypothetical protein
MGEIYSTERLAEVVSALAARAADPELRTQLHALSGIVANLDAKALDRGRRAELEGRIEAGIEAEDEPLVLAAMAELAALEREPLRWVDWSAASGG